MEAFKSSSDVTTYPGERDKAPRGAQQVHVEIDSQYNENPIGCGHALKAGVHDVWVLESELPRLKSMVQDDGEDARWETAVGLYENELDGETSEKLGGTPSPGEVQEARLKLGASFDDWHGSIEDFNVLVAASELNNAERAAMRARHVSLKSTGTSPVGMFYKQYRRDRLPFRSLKVLGKPEPLAEDHAVTIQNTTMVETVARVVAEVLKGEKASGKPSKA
jgi:hypothetical protein